MYEMFKVEIISPDKKIIETEASEVTIPSFEGLMGILKDHIPLVTFLRPGFIEVYDNKKNNKYFVEDGTVEFLDNNLLILSSSVKNIKNFSKEKFIAMKKEAENQINDAKINDKEKYILSYKIEALREVI